METRANYIAIGLFVLAGLAMAFGFLYWLVRFNESGDTQNVELVIPGSAGGLTKGSAVMFNGLRVGRVIDVSLDADNPQHVIAYMEVNETAPIRIDSTVRVVSQPLTGLATVEMIGGSANAQRLLDMETPTVEAIPGSLQDIIDQATVMAARAETIMERVETFVSANEQTLTKSISNVEVFTAALAENSDELDAFMKSVGKAAGSLDTVSTELVGAIGKTSTLLSAVEPERISSIVESVDTTAANLAKSSASIDSVTTDAQTALAEFKTFSKGLNGTLAKVDAVIDAVPPRDIKLMVANVGNAAGQANIVLSALDPEQLKNTLTNIEAVTGDFKALTGSADTVITQLSAIASSFGLTLGRVDTIVAGVDSDQLARTFTNIEAFSGALGTTLAKVDGTLDALDKDAINDAVGSLKSFAARLELAGGDIDGIMANAKTASNNVATLTSDLKTNTDDINAIVKDARAISTRLVTTSEIVNRLVGRVDNIVDADGESLLVEATEAARAIRDVAESFEARADEISGGLARFSTGGLSNVDALIKESRQAVRRVDNVIRNFEQNPAGFVFGGSGSSVPEYRGQRR